MEERRKWKRYEIVYPLEKEDIESALNVTDVARGGVAFVTNRIFHKEDRIDLRIFLKHKMFRIKTLVVYVKRIEDSTYSIGAKFLEAPNEFYPTLEKEIEEIKQFRRESTLYKHKDLSFKEASLEYLKNTLHV